LLMRATLDWRIAGEVMAESPAALRHEFFRCLLLAADDGVALEFLRKIKDESSEYCRIANERRLSVSGGHAFSSGAPGFEVAEIALAARDFGIDVGKDGDLRKVRDYLDTGDDSQVSVGTGGKPEFRVAGKSFFAGWQQRRLMGACNRLYYFFNDMWGVPDRARQFKAWIKKDMPTLRYKPFLVRMVARGRVECVRTNAPCAEVVRRNPAMVTPRLWARMDYNSELVKQGLSSPNIWGWFKPVIPAGTAFDIGRRINDVGVGNGSNVTWCRELWERNPYDYNFALTSAFVDNRWSYENFSTETVLKWLGKITDYHCAAGKMLADTYRNDPAKFEETMNKIADVLPDTYKNLGSYFAERGEDEKAAKYYLLAFERAQDRVSMANCAMWLVQYLYRTSDKTKALEVAKDAAEVYSYRGLEAYVWLMEQEGNWQEALKTSRNIDKRYNNRPEEETACLFRMRAVVPDEAMKLGFDKKIKAVFPKGVLKVGLADFSGKPTRGAEFIESNRQFEKSGLRKGMVVVALDGYRTDNYAQYAFIRSLSSDPKMNLIVWDGKQYLSKDVEVSGRVFGVDMRDYSGRP